MDKILQLLAVMGLAILSAFFRFFVFIKLWGYIAIPMGAPQIGLMGAFGISLLVGHLTAEYKENKDGTEEALKKVVYSFLSSAIAWGFGYWIFG